MLLTSTSEILNTELIPVFTGLISVGIIGRLVKDGIEAQADNIPMAEFFRKARKLIIAGILSITVTALMPVIGSYYQ